MKKKIKEKLKKKVVDEEIEIIPAILKTTFEAIENNWNKVESAVSHIQVDISDGVFAGDGTFRIIPWLSRLMNCEKLELHLMVHNPAFFVDEIINLKPARCIFHLEAFADAGSINAVYTNLRNRTDCELGLAINPGTPNKRLDEYMGLIDFVQFMGIVPGWTNQPLVPDVFNKIIDFKENYQDIPVAVDGHVNKETIGEYVRSGARRICAATAIFAQGNPEENITQLKLLAEAEL